MDRRTLLGSAIGAAACGAAFGAGSGSSSTGPPVIHCTDLHRPHVDPDDHWDLATVYALAYGKLIDLRAVIIDFPPEGHDPDVGAVAQMNEITGLSVPIGVGSPRGVAGPCTSTNLILNTLRQSHSPVLINVIGCCRTLAEAIEADRDLFAEKCCGIYLNAGTGSPHPARAAKIEYNVSLDPGSYGAMFKAPCPLYWMPCFEEMDQGPVSREFGTYWRFRQEAILPELSDRVRRYFAFLFSRAESSHWLRYLNAGTDEALLAARCKDWRNMWCTGGFFHSAGRTVTASGKVVGLAKAPADAVFSFDPIEVSCDEEGLTRWSVAKEPSKWYIFHVRRVDEYGPALTNAMKTLLMTLP